MTIAMVFEVLIEKNIVPDHIFQFYSVPVIKLVSWQVKIASSFYFVSERLHFFDIIIQPVKIQWVNFVYVIM